MGKQVCPQQLHCHHVWDKGVALANAREAFPISEDAAGEKTADSSPIHVGRIREPALVAEKAQHRSVTPKKGTGFHRPVRPICEHEHNGQGMFAGFTDIVKKGLDCIRREDAVDSLLRVGDECAHLCRGTVKPDRGNYPRALGIKPVYMEVTAGCEAAGMVVKTRGI